MQEYRFKVFGKLIAVTGQAGARQAFFLGPEGKRRPADFIIPRDIADSELAEYLGDLFHEDATPRYNTVERLA